MGLSLRAGFPKSSKRHLSGLFIKKTNLPVDDINNYQPVANVPFLSKLVGRVVADHFQALLEETNALDPFQSGFRPHHGIEMALITLQDVLLMETDGENVLAGPPQPINHLQYH